MSPINSNSVSSSQIFNPSSAISRTPPEVLEQIIAPLNQKDLLAMRGVSKLMSEVCNPFIRNIKAKNLDFNNSILDSFLLRKENQKTLKSFEDRLVFLRKLGMAVTLHLDSCLCTDSTFAALPKNIRHLKISNTFFNASNLNTVQRFEKLESLTLEEFYGDSSAVPCIPGQAIAALLGKAPNIKHLTLRRCSKLSISNIQSLPVLDQLKDLTIKGFSITGVSSELLQKAPNLESLTLSGSSKLNAQNIQSLPVFPKLKSLDLKFSTLSEDELPLLLQKAPNLEHLILMKHAHFIQTRQSLPIMFSLKSLSINAFIESSCEEPLQAAPNLEHLKLERCPEFIDQGAQSLPVLAQLKSLDLKFSPHSNNVFPVPLIQKAPNLEHLTLREYSNLTVRDIQALPIFPQVKSLDLKFSGLSKGALLALLPKVPNLEHLILMENKYSELCISEIQSLCALTQLKSLSINGVSVSIPVLRQHALRSVSDAPPNQV